MEYQLRTLQHQVTPHFMFNVLNHIHILMQTDVDLASDLLIKYSEILRYQLYNGDKQKVTLEQDIQFLKDFIAVEEIRWGDKLVVTSSWKIEQPQRYRHCFSSHLLRMHLSMYQSRILRKGISILILGKREIRFA